MFKVRFALSIFMLCGIFFLSSCDNDPADKGTPGNPKVNLDMSFSYDANDACFFYLTQPNQLSYTLQVVYYANLDSELVNWTPPKSGIFSLAGGINNIEVPKDGRFSIIVTLTGLNCLECCNINGFVSTPTGRIFLNHGTKVLEGDKLKDGHNIEMQFPFLETCTACL